MAGTDGRAAARPGQRPSGWRRESARAAWGERVAAEARQHEAFASWAEADMPPEALQQRRAASQRRLLGHVVSEDYDAAHELALTTDLGAARRAGGPLDAHAASALVVGASLKRLLGDAGPDAGGRLRALDIAHERAGAAGRVTAALLASAGAARYPLRKVDSASVFPFDEPRTEAGAALHVQRMWRGHAGRCAWFTKTTAQLQDDIAAHVAACDRSPVDVLSPKLRQRCKHALAQVYTDISGTCTLRGKVRRFTFVCVIELSELKTEVQAVRERSAPLLPPRPAALDALLRVAEQAVKESSTLSERLHSSALFVRMQGVNTVEEAALLMQQAAFHMLHEAELGE